MSHLRVITNHDITAAQECEQAVIGAVFMANGAYWRCKELGLESSDFAYAVHQKIWNAIEEMMRAGMEASPVTLGLKLQGDEQFKEVGGHGYLGRLASSAVPPAMLATYAETVKEWAVRRKLHALGTELQSRALSGQQATGDLLSEADATLNDCRSRGERGGLKPMVKVVKDTLESIERAQQREKVEGVETGLLAIDKALGGLADTDLIVLAGRPGMGKSALAGTIAQHVAHEHAVALFSLEMSAEQFAARMISGEARIETSRMRLGNMGAGEMHTVIEKGQQVGTLSLFIDDQAAIRPGDIRARLKILQRSVKVGLVVIDYLQLMRPDATRRDGSRVLELGEITGALKALAKEFSVPVLALSQLSRRVEERDDKRPILSDLRESGSIEQDADQVWFLYRDEYYAKREEPKMDARGDAYQKWSDRMAAAAGKAELIIAKNRHGADQTLMLAFDGRHARFANVEE